MTSEPIILCRPRLYNTVLVACKKKKNKKKIIKNTARLDIVRIREIRTGESLISLCCALRIGEIPENK